MVVFHGLVAAVLVLTGGVVAVPPAQAAGVPGAAAPADAPSVGTAPLVAAADVPDPAMLQPADLGGVSPQTADDDDWPQLRPPRPCGVPVPAPIAGRTVAAVIDVDGAPESIMEYLALHHDPGRYLRKLRKALRSCPDWRLEQNRADGLTLRWTRRWEHASEQITHHTFVAVARTGRAVVVVADSGWETADGDRAVAERLLASALRRASVLR